MNRELQRPIQTTKSRIRGIPEWASRSDRRNAKAPRARLAITTGGLLLGLALLPRRAAAFRTAADEAQFTGTTRVRWKDDLVHFQIGDVLPAELTGADMEGVARAALGAWSRPSCSRLVMLVTQLVPSEAKNGDALNTIQFVTHGWRSRGYDPTAPGFTDIQYQKDGTGQWVIIEADIYLNAEDFRWMGRGPAANGRRILESVLTHESGHALGLLHPCELGGARGAPDCALDPSFLAAAMYPIYSDGQTKVSQDDEAGVCFLYPGVSCEVAGCAWGTVCRSEGCLESCGHKVCSAEEFCTADGCWPKGKCWGPSCQLFCQDDADCGGARRCMDRRCTGGSPDGDPCLASTTCAGGICSTGGFCTSSCSNCVGLSCPKAEGGELTVCETAKLALGAPCSSKDDCLGAQCLAGADPAPACTRICSGSASACPAGWTCDRVENVDVCRPLNVVSGGGCSTARRDLSRSSQNHWFEIALSLSAFRIRRSASRARRAEDKIHGEGAR